MTDSVYAYDFSDNPVLESIAVPAAVFPIGEGVDPGSNTVAPDLRRAAYTTDDEMVCVDRDGNTLWRLDFGPSTPDLAVPNCRFSPDGGVVWLYRPDALAKRGTAVDRWLAVAAETGTVITQTELDTTGHGAHQFAHPDGHILLDVGEGQDGSRMYRGRLHQDAIQLTEYPWTDRVLVNLSPDGHHFMTVDQDQGDVAFHTYPDGETVTRIPAESFGYPDETYVEWSGGYLDTDTAVVVIGGETEDDEEWYRHHLVDVRTGQVHGTLDTESRDMYDLEPLGDGSWLSTHHDDQFWRHTR